MQRGTRNCFQIIQRQNMVIKGDLFPVRSKTIEPPKKLIVENVKQFAKKHAYNDLPNCFMSVNIIRKLLHVYSPVKYNIVDSQFLINI